MVNTCGCPIIYVHIWLYIVYVCIILYIHISIYVYIYIYTLYISLFICMYQPSQSVGRSPSPAPWTWSSWKRHAVQYLSLNGGWRIANIILLLSIDPIVRWVMIWYCYYMLLLDIIAIIWGVAPQVLSILKKETWFHQRRAMSLVWLTGETTGKSRWLVRVNPHSPDN